MKTAKRFTKGGPGGPGRPKGSRTKLPKTMPALIARLTFGNPRYLATLRRQIEDLTIHPDVLIALLRIAYGRPR